MSGFGFGRVPPGWPGAAAGGGGGQQQPPQQPQPATAQLQSLHDLLAGIPACASRICVLRSALGKFNCCYLTPRLHPPRRHTPVPLSMCPDLISVHVGCGQVPPEHQAAALCLTDSSRRTLNAGRSQAMAAAKAALLGRGPRRRRPPSGGPKSSLWRSSSSQAAAVRCMPPSRYLPRSRLCSFFPPVLMQLF